jgi:hypothetical protein
MHDIAQKHIFFKLPELDPDPDLVVNFPDPAKRSGFGSGSATLIRSEGKWSASTVYNTEQRGRDELHVSIHCWRKVAQAYNSQ